MTPLDAYVHIMQVLEQVNATMGNIFASDIMSKEVKANKVKLNLNIFGISQLFGFSFFNPHRTTMYRALKIVTIQTFILLQKVET